MINFYFKLLQASLVLEKKLVLLSLFFAYLAFFFTHYLSYTYFI